MLFDWKRLGLRRAPQHPSIETAATIVTFGAALFCRWRVDKQLTALA